MSGIMAREQRKSVFTLKFESETAENKKKMKYLCDNRNNVNRFSTSARNAKRGRGKENMREGQIRGRERLQNMTRLTTCQITPVSSPKLNKRRRETNNNQVDSNTPTHLKIVA